MNTNKQTTSGSKLAQIAALILLTALLAGCGSKVSGKYSNGTMSVEFKSDAKASLSVAGATIEEVKYAIQGDKVILRDPDGNLKKDITLTRKADGTLVGDSELGTFKKQ